ncbi:MAG: zinc ribbon domain-containing protein [bacterium]
MGELILLMILLATTAYVTKPYWQRRTAVKRDASNGQLTDLIERRDNLLAAIKEIEFDRQTGKISAEDFAEMNTKYRTEAVTVLKRIDALQGNNRASKKLEAELQRMRSQRKKIGAKFCPECGSSVRIEDRFCSACGNRLRH